MKNLDLKTRVALFTMAIFLCAVWLSAWHQVSGMQEGLQKLLFDQQHARVKYIANSINEALKVRIYSLATIADAITPDMLHNRAKLQAYLETQKPLGRTFSLGMYVVSADGKGIADYPVMDGRATADYTKREYFREVMATGKPVIGKPVIGRFAKQPVLLMAVPVMDKGGALIGVLVGANLIHGSDLFNEVQTSNLNQYGDIHIVSPKDRIFISSTDPARVLKPIAAPGVNKLLDRYVQGYDGSGIMINSSGIEALSSASHVAVTGWIVDGFLPTSIAFAPVKTQQMAIYRDAAAVSLLIAFVVGLFLRSQLAPLRNTALILHEMASGETEAKAVPVEGAPEIRKLLESFNILLQKLTEKDVARIQSDEALKESEERFKTYIMNSPHAIFVCNENGRYIDVNPAACSMTGYDEAELLALSIPDLLPPESMEWAAASFKQVSETGRTSGVAAYRRKNGDIGYWMLEGVKLGPTTLIAFVTDITEQRKADEERRNLELQMQQAQKLESLGVLAGGIAHDFNNILMSIMGNADLALMRLTPESPAVDNLKRIEQASARAADLAKQMLAYSGKGKFVVEHIDTSRLVEEMLHMLEVSISKKAVLRLNISTPLPSVEADATQLRQIIMNLVINASEAIGDKSGVIAINTGCMECDRHYLKSVWLDENLSAGLYVYVEISDTGCGMSRETLAKIFDPFYTTKFAGRGLGMAAVLGIVRGHKGAIKVYSEPNKGSSFKILFPAADRPPELFDTDPHKSSWSGSGTVLLVDDEETVRAIGSEMLRELGYQVVTAEDGRDAVEVFKARDDIDFVILDLTMPHMDGEQCFRELRQIKPGLKVIISSGYNQQEVTQKFLGKGLAGFIQKPYRLSALKEVLMPIFKK